MPAERPPKRRELAAMLRAARMVDRERKSLSGHRLAVAGLAATLLAAAVSSQKSAGIPHGSEPRPFLSSHRPVPGSNEEFRMRTSMSRSAAVVSSFAISASAVAQTAVQWRVEDGGNGHWYAVTSESLVYPALRQACESRGGHLATLTTQAEWSWVKTHFPVPYPQGWFVGGYQDHSASDYSEPNGGWRWVTGEPFSIDLSYMGSTKIFGKMTEPGFDDCPAGTIGYCGCGPDGAQDVLMIISCCNSKLDDIGDGIVQNCDSWARVGVIEWSADCNGDGIVDYGQIRAGDLTDTNANNVPDCCELGLQCPTPPQQWTGSGANGHWYAVALHPAGDVHWRFDDAVAYAQSRGAHLATFSDQQENTGVYNLLQIGSGYFAGWFGLAQTPGSAEPAGGWGWITGEPLTFSHWQPGEPNNTGCYEPSAIQNWGILEGNQTGGSTQGRWDDDGDPVPACQSRVIRAVIEWSADCNGDGIVDFGQIRAGTLADINHNNIPDCCEDGSCLPCRADIDQSGAINGVDLAAVLNNWGTSGGKQPRSDVNGDGMVDGADLAEVLNGWGPCN